MVFEIDNAVSYSYEIDEYCFSLVNKNYFLGSVSLNYNIDFETIQEWWSNFNG
jgi:hypothetical protein